MPKIRLVRDQLIPHAKVAVIGESPGKEEVLAGQPFVGPSGSLLNRFLFSAGLRRGDVAVLNVSLRRPSHNSDDIKIIPKEELDVWMQDLRRRLTLLPDVRLIVPLGNTALEAVLGTEKVTLTRNKKLTITKARGFYFDNVVLEDGRKVLVVPCFHPAATFRDQTLVKVCEEFWEKIGEELRRGLVSEHNTIGPLIDDTYTIEGMPHPDDALDFAHQIIRDGRDAPPVSYDIETPREVPREKILCVGFSNDGKFGMTIPFDDHRAVGPKEWREKFQEAVRLIVNSNVPKIGQNLLFDAHMLMFLKSIWSNEVIYDTRTMDLVLDPRRSHDLGSMVSRFLRARMWKDREEDSRVNDDYVELAEYCASDALHTWHVAMKIKALLEEQGLMSGYKRIYKARFYPLLRMQLEGTLVDQKARVTLYESLEKECASVRAELAEIAGVSLAGDEDKSLSDKKIASFLYGMKDPPKRALKLTKTGQVAKNQPPPLPKGLELKPIIDKDTQKPTTNEVALRTLRLRVEGKNKRASHAIDLILRHREKHQLSTFLRGERVDKDDRMRCSFGFAETGRLTSSSNPVGTGCVPGDAEILTPSGWKRFDSIDDLVQAMVWDPKTNTLRFQSASRVSFDYTGEMCAVSSWFHSGLYTPDHRIPWVRATKAAREQFSEVCQSDLRVDTANSFSEPHSERLIPISSLYLQGQVSFPEIRLLAAVQADGSFEPDGSMRIALYKPRKIKRFKEICSELKLEYTEHRCQRDGTRFRLKRTSVARCFELLGRTKQFGSWLLAFDQITLKTLIEEAAFWDGSIRNRSYQYSSIHKNNVEWLCTIAHLVGYSGSFRCKDNRRPGSFGEESAKPLWTANIKPRDYTNDESKHWNTLPFSGRVYCLTTSTGFFLCRQNGRIVITGNSNTQNPARPMRHIFLPNPGCIFVSVDLSCVEDRIIKCYSKDPDLIRLARLPAYDYDAHKDLAAKIFGVEPKDVDKAQRYMGKKVRHACATGETEMLTPFGWVRMDSYDGRAPIAVWNSETTAIHFERPIEWNAFDYSGELVSVSGMSVAQDVTPNHRIFCYHSTGSTIYGAVHEANDFTKYWKIPLNGGYSGNVSLDPKLVQLIVAVQADGSRRSTKTISINLVKERKIARLRELLTSLQMEWKESEKGVTKANRPIIRFEFKLPENVAEFLTYDRHFNWNLLSLDDAALDTFLDELPYWDGTEYTRERGRTVYRTSIYRNAQIVQTIAHLRGRRALLRTKKISVSGYGKYLDYQVAFKNTSTGTAQTIERKPHEGKVYCPTTSTGFFLIRLNDRVSVTGNSQRNVKGQRFADELLKEGTVRPKSWCDEVLEAYHIAEPGIRAGYFPYVEERVMKYEELVSPWGYRVSYKGERKDPDLMREAYSFLPQAGAVFTLDTQGLIPLDWLIAKEGLKSSRINNQVHDSVIVSCPLDEAYFVAEFLVSNLEKPVEYDGVDLSVPSEVKLSATLADDDAVDWKRFPSEEDFMREAEKMFEIAERRRHESQMFAVEWKKKVRIQAREEAKQKEEALRLVEEEKARKVAAKEAEKEAKRLAREEKKIERERLKAEKLAAKAEAKEARRLKREAKAAATNKTK